jgi:hypothetical protein
MVRNRSTLKVAEGDLQTATQHYMGIVQSQDRIQDMVEARQAISPMRSFCKKYRATLDLLGTILTNSSKYLTIISSVLPLRRKAHSSYSLFSEMQIRC